MLPFLAIFLVKLRSLKNEKDTHPAHVNFNIFYLFLSSDIYYPSTNLSDKASRFLITIMNNLATNICRKWQGNVKKSKSVEI